MQLKNYLSLIKHWSWLIILFTLLAAGSIFLLNKLSTPIFRSSTTLLINQAPASNLTPDLNSLTTSERLAKTYKELLKKRPVLETVIRNLNLNTNPETLAKNEFIELLQNTQLLILSVEDTSPERAARITNEIAKIFNSQNQNLQEARYSASKQGLQKELAKIQLEITTAQTQLDNLKPPLTSDQLVEQNRLQTLDAQYRASYSTLFKSFEDVSLAEAQAVSNLSVVEEAIPEPKAVRPSTATNTLLGAIIGALLALGLAGLIEYLNDSVKDTQQAEQLTGAPILGLIPRDKGGNTPDKLISLTQPNSPPAEAYRVLSANIELSGGDKPIQTLLLTSSLSGEGKTTIICNLAVAMARSGKRVILIDTDLRRPSIHLYFNCENTEGLTTALLTQNSLVSDYLIPTEVKNLNIIASGPFLLNPADLLGSPRMAELVEELKSLADIVLFDSSPVLPLVDQTLLARFCDAILLVVYSGRTSSETLERAKAQLKSSTPLLGVVLNRILASQGTSYLYYNYPANKKHRSRLLSLPGLRRSGYYRNNSPPNSYRPKISPNYPVNPGANENLTRINEETNSRALSPKPAIDGGSDTDSPLNLAFSRVNLDKDGEEKK